MILGEYARNVRVKIRGLSLLEWHSCFVIVYYMALFPSLMLIGIFVILDWSHECSRIFESIRWVRSLRLTFSLRCVAPLRTDHYFLEGGRGWAISKKTAEKKNV